MTAVLVLALLHFVYFSYGQAWGPVAEWIKPNGPTRWRW